MIMIGTLIVDVHVTVYFSDRLYDLGCMPESMRVRLILFDLILFVPLTIFQLNRDGSSWAEPVLSFRINVSCSRTTTQ